MIIYKTTNLVNGKIYIGLDSKNNPNYLGSGTSLLLAIKKYGKDNFIKEIIEECTTMDQLKEREIYWIDYYNATNEKIGYNISLGGDGSLGRPCKESTKEKLRKANIGKKHKPESIEKMKGRVYTEEEKEKMRIRNTGKKHTEEAKLKMSKVQKGKYVSEETRKKQSLAKKGKPNGRGIPQHILQERDLLKRQSILHEYTTLVKSSLEEQFQNNKILISSKTPVKNKVPRLGIKPTEESLEKMRKARLGTKASELTKAKLRMEQKKRIDCTILFEFSFALTILERILNDQATRNKLYEFTD